MVYRLLFPVEAESYLVSEEEEEELDDVELQDDSEEVEVGVLNFIFRSMVG